jgi:hypothetical protein
VPTSSFEHLFSAEVDGILASSGYGYAHSLGAASTGSPSPAILPNATLSAQNVTITSNSPGLVLENNATSPEPTRVSNATCTINIPSASLDYWYPATYSLSLGTMTTQFANYSKTDSYTLVTNTATFDAASALESDFACTWSMSALPDDSYTFTWCIDYNDKPTAAATSVVYRSGFVPFPPGNVIPITETPIYDIYKNLPMATHPITIAPNRTFEQVSATPVVHFTAYEVESGNKTETVQLPSTYVYPYWIKDVQHDVAAKGPLPDEFMQRIPQVDCDSGELQAVVNVLVVVDMFYENVPLWDPMFIHFESSVDGFNDPPVSFRVLGSTMGLPLTVDDYTLTDAPAKPTPMPSIGPAPTTPAGGNNNNVQQGAGSNEAQVPNTPQPTEVTIGNIGTLPVVLGPSSVVVVGSQTLQPGGPALIVDGVTPVSLVPSATAIVVGGTKTLQLPQVIANPIPPPVLTIGSSTLTPNAATQFFVAPGQTLTPGGTAIIDGTLVSLAPSASLVVVGGSTQFLPTAAWVFGTVPTSPPQIVVGGTTITALSAQGNSGNGNSDNQNNAASGPTFVVDGLTLAPGAQAITVAGTTLSLAPGGASVIVNGVTSAVANPQASFSEPTITVGNNMFTPISGPGNTFVIDGQTLAPGGQAITVSGTVVSLAPSASFVVVNGATSTLANSAAAPSAAAPVLTIGNSVFRPLPGSGTSYLVGSSILTPGGIITVAGSTISLAAGATALVINGQTSSLTTGAQPVITNAPLLTVGSNTFTATSGTTYIIDGQTLTPGGTITVDGTTISLAPGATQLVYGSSGSSTTTALFPATTTKTQGTSGTASASAGASGINGQAAPTSQRTGSASHPRTDVWVLSFIIATLVVGLLLY